MKKFLLSVLVCLSLATQAFCDAPYAEASFTLRGADAMVVYIDGYQLNDRAQSVVWMREIPAGCHQVEVVVFRNRKTRRHLTQINLKRNFRTNYTIGVLPNGAIVLNKTGGNPTQNCGNYNQNNCTYCQGTCRNDDRHSYQNHCNDQHNNDGHNGNGGGWGNNGNNGNDGWGNGGNNGNGGGWGNGGNNGNNGNGGGWGNGGNNGNNGNGGGWGNGGNNGNGGQFQNKLDINDLTSRMRSSGFDSDRLTLAKRAVVSSGILSQEVALLLKQFSFESSRLDFAKYAYAYTQDQNNYFKVYDSFDFSSSSQELDKFIGR